MSDRFITTVISFQERQIVMCFRVALREIVDKRGNLDVGTKNPITRSCGYLSRIGAIGVLTPRILVTGCSVNRGMYEIRFAIDKTSLTIRAITAIDSSLRADWGYY